MRDYHEAEDITHNVFAKLMTAIAKYEERAVPFTAWIMRVARNAALDHLPARRAVPTENYLLDPPLLAEHWLATAWSGLALAASAAGPRGDEGEPTPLRPSPHRYISSSSLAQDGR